MEGAGPLMAIPGGAMANPAPLSVSPLPSAVYQFVPHTPLQLMEAALPEIAAMGFTAVQMPPLHPPGMARFDGKVGSAYAPRDLTLISPHMYGAASPDQYLAGNFPEQDPEAGWTALRAFTAKAGELGLRVVGDLVFAHTARDPDAVAAHERKFGESFYKVNGNGSSGAELEDGTWDQWSDIRPINHAGPARRQILEHFQGVVGRFIESGVTVFRADAAPRIPNDFWAQLIAGAREFASANGHPAPVFYAEALDDKIEDEVSLIRDGGFDGVTTSLRWWKNLTERWLVDRMDAVRRVGGSGVSFMDNHDTARAVTTFHGLQGIFRQLALTAFMTSSMAMLAGTVNLDPRQPSVFLDWYRPPASTPNPDFAHARSLMEGAIGMLLDIKARYPIFRTPAYTELIYDGSPVLRIQRTTPSEQVQIAVNIGDREGAYHVPPLFRQGNIFGTNTWRNSGTWYGATPGVSIFNYQLAPGGVAVFHRDRDPSEDPGIPR